MSVNVMLGGDAIKIVQWERQYFLHRLFNSRSMSIMWIVQWNIIQICFNKKNYFGFYEENKNFTEKYFWKIEKNIRKIFHFLLSIKPNWISFSADWTNVIGMKCSNIWKLAVKWQIGAQNHLLFATKTFFVYIAISLICIFEQILNQIH